MVELGVKGGFRPYSHIGARAIFQGVNLRQKEVRPKKKWAKGFHDDAPANSAIQTSSSSSPNLPNLLAKVCTLLF
jgi:hypothetical protein